MVRLRYTFTGAFDANWEDYTNPGPEGILNPDPALLARIVQETIEDGTVTGFLERLPKDGQTAVLVQPATRPCPACQDDDHDACEELEWVPEFDENRCCCETVGARP